jgi:hypothetical protein
LICIAQLRLYSISFTCIPDVYSHIVRSNLDVDGSVLNSNRGSDVLLADCFADNIVEKGSFTDLTVSYEDN